MSVSRIVGIIAGVALLFVVAHFLRDPHRTALPFGSTDFSSVESALRKLPAGERALVESYVKRSNGDVLPAQFADPDNPFTARTFGEAIELEKRWQVKMRAQQAVADARAEERDAAMAPLREAVTASVARSEVITRNEFDARLAAAAPAPAALPGAPKVGHANDSREVFVTTVSIDNHTDADIVALQGRLEARHPDKYLPMELCWVDLGAQRTIAARGHLDISCANRNLLASPDERAFVADQSGFTVVWLPKTVKLSDGKVLDSKL